MAHPSTPRARRGPRTVLAAAILAIVAGGCGGAGGGEREPDTLEVGSEPTPDTPPSVGVGDAEGVPAVPGRTEGVGPEPSGGR